jgi:hypothetical protein
VKVVPVIVAGFIATLKVAVTGALGHTPVAAATGATGVTIGAANSGLAPELQQPVLKMSKSAINQILELLFLPMTVILFVWVSLCRAGGSQLLQFGTKVTGRGLAGLSRIAHVSRKETVLSHFGTHG